MSLSPLQHLHAWVAYLNDMGVYDLYRRDDAGTRLPEDVRAALLAEAARVSAGKGAPAVRPVATQTGPAKAAGAAREGVPSRAAAAPLAGPFAPAVKPPVSPVARKPAPPTQSEAPTYFDAEPSGPVLPPELAAPMPKPKSFDELAPLPAAAVPAGDRAAALEALRAEIGDCTRCPLAYAGRHTIVFADGDPNAKLMFVGEGPGADEDASGLPFVGKAGQLLNNMINAMGLKREEVYIANIVKCRPPANRTPEFAEATTCSQFLLRQIDIVQPKVIVALGATAATYLLGVRQTLGSLRGQWFQARGAKVAVTFHPAFLLRDPRQKGEAWKDLQRVMAELGLQPPPRKTS